MFYPAQVGSGVFAQGIPIPPTLQVILGPIFQVDRFAGVMAAVSSDPHQAAIFLFIKGDPGSSNPFSQVMEDNFLPGVAGVWTEAQADTVIGLTTVPQGFVDGDTVHWALAGTADINDVIASHPEIPHSDGQPFPDVPPPMPVALRSAASYAGGRQSWAKQYNQALASKRTPQAQPQAYGRPVKIMV